MTEPFEALLGPLAGILKSNRHLPVTGGNGRGSHNDGLVVLRGPSSRLLSLYHLAQDQSDRTRRPTSASPARQHQRRLTESEVVALAEQYQAGKQMDELAAIFGVHRTTVATQLRQSGVRLRSRGVPQHRRDEAVQLYGEGWSCQRLAERYTCNATTVWKVLQQAGVRLRAPWERS